MTSLSGKKAVVSGGTNGIGLALASALQQRGAEVLVTGRSEANVAAAQRTLGAGAHVLRSDTTNLSEIRELALQVERRLGAIDAVFLNAGYCKPMPVSEVSESEYDKTFGVNAKGLFFTVQCLAPLVREGGAFVFTTSVANRTGYPGMSTYAGAKAAVRSFAQSFAVELLSRRIRVNALSPGFVRTSTMGLEGASPDELLAFVREGEVATPLGRIATVEEIARAGLFLAFDATFTTGEELLVDGGLTQLTIPHAPL